MNCVQDIVRVPNTLGLLKFMHRVGIDKANGWKNLNPNGDLPAVPEEIDAICGFCNFHVALTCDSYTPDGQTRTVCMQGVCRRCREASMILMTGYKDWSQYQRGERPDEFWILPKPSLRQIKIRKESLPEDIFDAYEEAINCFNGSHWRATVTECGRALEGVTLDKFPSLEDRKTLKKISSNKTAGDTVKETLFLPILDLTSAIRLGRMTGAHFNIKGKADKEVADRVLDMTEYMIKYFYELPEDAQALEETIGNLGDKGLISEDIE